MQRPDVRLGDTVLYFVTSAPRHADLHAPNTTARPAIVVAVKGSDLDLQVFIDGPDDPAALVEFSGEEVARGLAFRRDVALGTLPGNWSPLVEDLAAPVDHVEQLLQLGAVVDLVCENVSPGEVGDVELRAERGDAPQAIDGYARLAIQDPVVFRQFVIGGRYRMTIEVLEVPDRQVLDTTGETEK